MKMLGTKSMSQRYILHRTYTASKINIPNYTLRTTEINTVLKIIHRAASVTAIAVWGEGTDRKFQPHMPQS